MLAGVSATDQILKNKLHISQLPTGQNKKKQRKKHSLQHKTAITFFHKTQEETRLILASH